LYGGFNLSSLKSVQFILLKKGWPIISLASAVVFPSRLEGFLSSSYVKICFASGLKYSFISTGFSTMSLNIYFLFLG
jgi:hypothetical protein